MTLQQLAGLVERLRKEAIGEPKWIATKEVFEYQDHSAKVVAVLKLVRAAQGVSALSVLCQAGLFIDFGAIIRCVNDAAEEVYFLLEGYPKTNANVDQFVKAFFEKTIDGHLEAQTHTVPTKKVRSAMVRVLKGGHDDAIRKVFEKIHGAFSGYVHANYAHIMEVYNGATDDFNLLGVPSDQLRKKRMAHVELAAKSVLHAAAYLSGTIGLIDLNKEIMQYV